MARINSKKKGNRGELIICKILSDHFGETFNRVPASGAISTIHKLSTSSAKTLAGDIICPDLFKFTIENKFGYEIDLYNLFQKDNGDKKKIGEFLSQSIVDCGKTVSMSPMVIYTRTRKKPLVFLLEESFSSHKDIIRQLDQYMVFNHNNVSWIVADFVEVLVKFPKDFFFEKANG